MSTSTNVFARLLSLISPWQYVVASLVAVLWSPTNFLLVWVTIVVLYHVVLSQEGFVDADSGRSHTDVTAGQSVLNMYRLASPVLVILGVAAHYVEALPLRDRLSGLLIATGTGLILGVKTVTFARSGV